MYRLGRTMQVAGLVILPVAILLELEGQVSLWKSLTISGFGAVLFALGYVLQSLGTR